MIFDEQQLGREERIIHVDVWGETLQAEGTARANT